MPKVFITGIALFLLLAAAGYGIATLQARAIPWDCSDWQAFAHDDRTTAILESLAENRGKALYCGVDQSDTFAKAETWEAGKDRNERDDTVYQGEQGRFRGFIAAQEGWLTDGESGITGMSIDRIFEFPREEKKRRKREQRLSLVYDREYPNSELAVLTITSNGNGPTTGYLGPNLSPPPTWARTPRTTTNAYVIAFGRQGAPDTVANDATAQANARDAWIVTDGQAAEWARNGNGEATQPTAALLTVPGGATEECVALGYRRATNVRWRYYDSDGDGNPNLALGPDEDSRATHRRYRAYAQIFYTATCKK